MGLLEGNETSLPLRQHGTYTKRKRGELAPFIKQIIQRKKTFKLSYCNVYFMALVNCCCWIWSWAWHGFSIWFTAMLRLNSSLWFLNVNLFGLGSIFQRHSKCHYEICIQKRKSYTHARLQDLSNTCTVSRKYKHTSSHISTHVFPVCIHLNTMCLPCG